MHMPFQSADTAEIASSSTTGHGLSIVVDLRESRQTDSTTAARCCRQLVSGGFTWRESRGGYEGFRGLHLGLREGQLWKKKKYQDHQNKDHAGPCIGPWLRFCGSSKTKNHNNPGLCNPKPRRSWILEPGTKVMLDHRTKNVLTRFVTVCGPGTNNQKLSPDTKTRNQEPRRPRIPEPGTTAIQDLRTKGPRTRARGRP